MRRVLALLAAVALLGLVSSPPAAAAAGPGTQAASAGPLGSITGLAGNLVGAETGTGNPVDALSAGAGVAESLALGAFASGVLSGASSALREAAHVISRTTAPRLQSTWFSSAYWRVAGLAALLSLPFLFAAAAQAVLRADPLLLARSVFGYLPLAVIAVNLAAPITMLLLSATDEMSAVIAGAGMGGGAHFLQQTAEATVGLATLDGSPFLAIVVGLLTLAFAVALAVEMLIREAAVYIVVLMLPLAFAALIWPARRSWAVRLIELLVALILSKFVIVAVLSLAGAAYGTSGSPSATRLLTAMTLVLLSTFAPWVMLRLLPFTELAAGAAGGIRGELPRLANLPREVRRAADTVAGRAESLVQILGHQAGQPDADGSTAGASEGTRGPASAAAACLPGEGSRMPDGPGSDESLIEPARTSPEPAGIADGPQPDGVSAIPGANGGLAAGGAPATPGANDGSGSGGSLTTQAVNGGPGTWSPPGDTQRGPFPEMEAMWQFDELTPGWISLDPDGVRRVAGPHPPGGPGARGPEPVNPGAEEPR
jgi:hypothetical protein